MPERRSAHGRRWLVAGVVAVPLLLFVLWWFEPQALLLDDVVDEEFPAAAPQDAGASSSPGDTATTDQPAPAPTQDTPTGGSEAATEVDEPAEPVVLSTGSFASRNRYTVTGTATAYELADGQRILRLEDFESTNGPDLFVYLTAAGSGDDDDALDADFVDLGVLTGNIGDQNYVIPADVDLDRYSSVTIWCRRFTTSFGVADLT